MGSFLADTNVLVAAVCTSHVHYERSSREIRRRLTRGEDLVLAAHALVECYAVLTRLPAPSRFTPADAFRVIEHNYASRARLVALTASETLALLESASRRDVEGGVIYDAIIARVAEVAGVEVMLTFNERHFLPLLGHARVVVPSGE